MKRNHKGWSHAEINRKSPIISPIFVAPILSFRRRNLNQSVNQFLCHFRWNIFSLKLVENFQFENSKRKVEDFGLGLEMNGLGIEFLKCPVSWTIFLFHVVAEPDLKLITAMEEKWVSCLNFGYKDWKIQIFCAILSTFKWIMSR